MSNPAAADSAIELMQDAAEANWQDIYREGMLVRLPAAGELMVTGDLHGNPINYQKIVELAGLSRDRSRHLIIHEIVHALAHTVDGRDMSFQVLEMSARLKAFFPNQVHFIIGNHDLGEITMSDIQKGGQSSLAGLDRGLAVAYGELKDEVRAAYHGFMASMPAAVQTDNGIFVSHSIPELRYQSLFSMEGFLQELQAHEFDRQSYLYRLVWGRKLDQETADSFAEIVGSELLITGHMPMEDGFAAPNTRQLVLDSKDDKGCYVSIPLDESLTHNQLIQRVRRIRTNKKVL